MVPCHHGNACPQVADGGTASNMGGSYEKNRISSLGQPTRGGPPACGLDEVLKPLFVKKQC